MENLSNLHGTFRLHNLDVWGELTLFEERTQLKLRAETNPSDLVAPKTIQGTLHDFKRVTCVECIGGHSSTSWRLDGGSSWSWKIFPHQVLIGPTHFDPVNDRIRKVWFTTQDIHRIFDDFDAFGSILNSDMDLQALLPKTIGGREVPAGPDARIVYFAGKAKPVETSLSFGHFEIQHWPSIITDSLGAHIKNEIRIQITFSSAVDLEGCLTRLSSVGQFLSLVAGRTQSILDVQIGLVGHEENELPLCLHWSLGPRMTNSQEQYTPSWRDMPLDGIRRMDEFTQVLRNWFNSDKHDLARARLYSCRESGDEFNVDRLVAAANMFDLIVSLSPVELSSELKSVLDASLAALRELPFCENRDGAINALSRIGGPTLRQRIRSRSNLLKDHFPLANLDKVLRQAVICRNYFVHGPSGKLDYQSLEPHISFLTETLEFVFAAAEFIECGWSARDWKERPHSSNHWFSRFISKYPEASRELLRDMEKK